MNAINGKCRFSGYASSETPWPIFTKIGTVDYVVDPSPYARIGVKRFKGGVSAYAWNCHPQASIFLFFNFMRIATGRLVGSITAVNRSRTQPVGVHIPYMVSIITINIFPVCLWWCQFALRVKIALPWFDIYRSQSPSQLSPFVTCCLPCAWSLASSLSARQCPRIQGTSTYWR